MYPSENQLQSTMYDNIPNMSLAFTMYTTTFGNGNFVIQPPMKGEVSDGFPTIPYLSLEALLYNGQSSNPANSPVNITSGQYSGQHNVQGQFTVTDQNGQTRVQIGSGSF